MRIRSVFAAIAAAVLVVACGSDGVTDPGAQVVLGLAATPKGATSIQLSFTGTLGDVSYTVERATGASGAFASVTSVPAPAAGGTVTWTDNGLTANTVYRYRVITLRGSASSAPSGEISISTLTFGSFAATINQDITASRTLFADTAYTISGFIHVLNGATLTIEPGTKIKGDFNVLGSSLIIMRGAKITAIGTAAAPIVFTSSRAAGQRQPGDWGGLIIVGNAPDNRSGTVNIEGSGTDGTAIVSGKNYPVQYNGGTVAADNSGTLAYVRVEFAGYGPRSGPGVQLLHLRGGRHRARAPRTSSRLRASMTRSSSSAAASTSITSSPSRPATTCSTCPRASRDASSSSSRNRPRS